MRPPWPNQSCEITTVRPAARKVDRNARNQLIATKGDRGQPVNGRQPSEAAIPAKSPNQTDPVAAAMAAEKKAAASILPSSPMSKMPARSENRPARQASSSGVAKRTVLSSTCREREKIHQPVSLSAAAPETSAQAASEPLRSRAPVNRITSAWMTTISSRGILVQSASSAPPW